MKLLTLAVAIALLGMFGCDEPNQMMQQVTRETGEIGETGGTAPTAGDVLINWNGAYCPDPYWCDPSFSYTNVLGEDNTGQVTIYVDIPEAVGDGPHTVHLIWDPDALEMDIPNQRLAEFPEWDFKRMEATFFLKRGDTIVFNYELISEGSMTYGSYFDVLHGEGLRIRDAENVTEGNVEFGAELPAEWDESLEAIRVGSIVIKPSTE